VQRVRHQRKGVKRMRADAAMRLTQRTRTGLPPTHGHPVRPSALHLPQHIRRSALDRPDPRSVFSPATQPSTTRSTSAGI
jgi:hypothetical protein